jgi:hypothetical protein
VGGGPAYPSSPRAGGRSGGGSNPAALRNRLRGRAFDPLPGPPPARGRVQEVGGWSRIPFLPPGRGEVRRGVEPGGPAGAGSAPSLSPRQQPRGRYPLPGPPPARGRVQEVGGWSRISFLPPGREEVRRGVEPGGPAESRLRGRAFDPLPGPPPARGRVQEVGGGPAYPSSPRAGGRLGGGSNPAVLLEPAQGAGVRPPPQPSPCPGEGVGGGGRSRVPFLPPAGGRLGGGSNLAVLREPVQGADVRPPSRPSPCPGEGALGAPPRLRRRIHRTGQGSTRGTGSCAGAPRRRWPRGRRGPTRTGH